MDGTPVLEGYPDVTVQIPSGVSINTGDSFYTYADNDVNREKGIVGQPFLLKGDLSDSDAISALGSKLTVAKEKDENGEETPKIDLATINAGEGLKVIVKDTTPVLETTEKVVKLPQGAVLNKGAKNYVTIDAQGNENPVKQVYFNTLAYKRIFTTDELRTPLLISIVTTLVTTFLGLLISTLGAYVLIQKDMPGVKIFSYLLMFTMIFNGGLIPTFLVMKRIGLLDSLWAVMLPMSMNVYNLVLMRSFFEQLPESLFEAAEIDGCTPMGIFIKIVLPLSKAALASIGLFFAVAAWSEYFHYVIYIKSTSKYNFQYKLRDLFSDKTDSQDGEAINVNMLKSAGVIVSIIPFLFIYPFCQKYFMTGVTMGAVKE
ncbi:MAG: carbohydrate ABC transporter permease [Firmicutes bacterium]|nr:carbohydrate ABC transporter permease [Bacillota bacterium]